MIIVFGLSIILFALLPNVAFLYPSEYSSALDEAIQSFSDKYFLTISTETKIKSFKSFGLD